MQLNFLTVMSLLTSTNSLVLSIYFVSRRSSRQVGHHVLGSILFLFALLVLGNMLSVSNFLQDYSKTLFLSRHLALIIIPLVYLYVQTLLRGKAYEPLEYIKHFALFIVSTPILIALIYPVEEFDIYHSDMRFVSGFLILGQNGYYLTKIFKLIQAERARFKAEMKVKWLTMLFLGFLFIWMAQFCSYVLIDLYRDFWLCPYTNGMYLISSFAITYSIIFFIAEIMKFSVSKIKNRNPEVDEQQLQKVFDEIEQLFKISKPYLDNQFSLQRLAKTLGYPIKPVSKAINSLSGHNFSEYVSQYRLEASAEMLNDKSKENLSIAEVYFLVGYNSKSTFFTAFKKRFGQTPTEYRKSRLNVLEEVVE